MLWTPGATAKGQGVGMGGKCSRSTRRTMRSRVLCQDASQTEASCLSAKREGVLWTEVTLCHPGPKMRAWGRGPFSPTSTLSSNPNAQRASSHH